jgi:hypothetical protein
VPDRVGETSCQNLPQPVHEFCFGAAAELGKIAVGFQESLLNHVRRIELALKPLADLQPCQEHQVILIQLQKAPQGRTAAAARALQELLRVLVGVGVHGSGFP